MNTAAALAPGSVVAGFRIEAISAVFNHPYAFAVPGSPRYRCLTEAVRAAA